VGYRVARFPEARASGHRIERFQDFACASMPLLGCNLQMIIEIAVARYTLARNPHESEIAATTRRLGDT
jgi:hypothetical protein